jgi:hypothetical protein
MRFGDEMNFNFEAVFSGRGWSSPMTIQFGGNRSANLFFHFP